MTKYGIFINPEEWDSLLSDTIHAEKIGFDYLMFAALGTDFIENPIRVIYEEIIQEIK
jgi:hypothetical protein